MFETIPHNEISIAYVIASESPLNIEDFQLTIKVPGKEESPEGKTLQPIRVGEAGVAKVGEAELGYEGFWGAKEYIFSLDELPRNGQRLRGHFNR
jgi:hypothetical protein